MCACIHAYIPLVFTRGIVVWTSLVHSTFHYNVESMDHGFYTKYANVHALPWTITISAVFSDKEGNPANMGDTE